jgi:hypothetical protein
MEMNVEKNQGYENLKATNRPQYRLWQIKNSRKMWNISTVWVAF